VAGALVVVGVVVLAGCGTDDEPTITRFEAGGPAGEVVLTDDAVWVTDPGHPVVTRLDRDDGVVAEVALADPAQAIAAGDEAVWVADVDGGAGSVHRIDPEGDELTGDVHVGDASDLAVAPHAVWAALLFEDRIVRIDPTSLEVVAEVEVGETALGLDVSGDAVWVTHRDDNTLAHVDARTNEVLDTVPSQGSSPFRVVATDDVVWVGNFGHNGTVTRLDVRSGATVTSAELDAAVVGLAVTDEAVWVSDGNHGRILRLDPSTLDVDDEISLGGSPFDLVAEGDTLWVSDADDAVLTRVEI
jgi:YVTN family beta-propeller protein